MGKLYKLIGTSDMKLARRLGGKVGIWTITHGDTRARITEEKNKSGLVLVIEYRGEVYELESIKATA